MALKIYKNEHGLDVDYFTKYMKRVLRDIRNYTPDELNTELERMQSALPNYECPQQKEAELRAEYQKKISEINLEHDSRVCSNCDIKGCEIYWHLTGKVKNINYFGCNRFKRKQWCTLKNSN